MTGLLPPPSRPMRKLFEPSFEQQQRGVVWVDRVGGEFADFTPNQRLAGLARRHAREWHRGQLDKQGRDYFMHHLWPVAEMARSLAIGLGLDADTVDFVEGLALLHDCREDQGVTDDMLIAAGLGDYCEGVEHLSKTDGTPYQVYIVMLVQVGSIEVVVVKLADNFINSTTLDDLPFEDQERMGPKYDEARPILMGRVMAHGQK